MTRTAKKTRREDVSPESYIFEIVKWEPSYFLTVGDRKHREGPYYEHAGLDIEASCIFPENMKGRAANFHVAGARDCLTPRAYQNDPEWTPRCVGELELSPSYGRFYTSIPHDSLAVVLSTFAHGLFKFILVYGPTLKRNKSLCSSMHFMQNVNLEEY